jgi:hypothetical protein
VRHAVSNRRLAVLSVGFVLAACVSASHPTDLPKTAAPPRTATPATSPSDPAPTPSPTARIPDRYPAEMLGAVFAVRPTPDGDVLLRRIGEPGGMILPTSERPLGAVGDRLVTARGDARAATITVWSVELGRKIAEPVRWPAKLDDATVVGNFVVARSGGRRLGGGVAGLIAINTADGGVRSLVEPGEVSGLAAPYRTIGGAVAGDAIATTICEQGMESLHDCRRTSIIDLATGAVRSTIDAGDYPVIAYDADWFLVSDSYGTIGAVDPAGRPLWASESLVAWTAFIPDERTVLAESREGDDGPVIMHIDPLTGSQEALTEPTRSEAWYLWAAYSTGTLIALGLEPGSPCRPESGGCDPAALPVIAGGVLDLETRTLTPDAFHITVMP